MASSHITSIQLPLAIEDATIEIPLYGGYLTTVDALDAEFALLHWSVQRKRNRLYVSRVEYSIHKTVYLHRLIMSSIQGRVLGRREYVDHWDNDPFNNRRGNLRLCTNKENIRNGGMRKNNTSGYKGVSLHYGRWNACISVDRKTIHLGTFDTPELAHEAYCKAAVKYFGEFARFD